MLLVGVKKGVPVREVETDGVFEVVAVRVSETENEMEGVKEIEVEGVIERLDVSEEEGETEKAGVKLRDRVREVEAEKVGVVLAV
jgi:hypothetical protein